MIVHAKISALKASRWYEYGARFAFGGITTLIAGVIGDRYGPETGGLFLAFPAIFCASATLIETHERKRKKEHGLDGYRRGTDAAALDASGGSLGRHWPRRLWVDGLAAGARSFAHVARHRVHYMGRRIDCELAPAPDFPSLPKVILRSNRSSVLVT
jgi:hypothetical protein